MTIYERLFGTPERAARAIEELDLTNRQECYLMDVFDDDIKCINCLFKCDRYGCKRKDISISEWLAMEVRE